MRIYIHSGESKSQCLLHFTDISDEGESVSVKNIKLDKEVAMLIKSFIQIQELLSGNGCCALEFLMTECFKLGTNFKPIKGE